MQKKRRGSSSDEDNAFDGNGRPQERVFDSDDDSDNEQSFHMTGDRKKVLAFLNEATNELLAVKGETTE